MTWVKLSDTALDEPFLLDLPRGVVLMHLEALSYSNRYGTDGVIHRAALRKITTEPDPEAAAEALCDAKLWAPIQEGWQLAWLLNDQPTAEEIESWKQRQAERQARHRRHVNGDHSTCDPKRCHVLIAVTRDKTRDKTSDKRPSRPDPTRPDPKRGGEEDGRRAAKEPPPPSREVFVNGKPLDEATADLVADSPPNRYAHETIAGHLGKTA